MISRGGAVCSAELAAFLRLIVITDRQLAHPQPVESVVLAALRAGARAVQLRDKAMPTRELTSLAGELLTLTRRYGGLFFVNDRLDVALAVGADGVHIGPNDPPLADLRQAAPDILIGFSADDPTVARRAQEDGASYIGCGAVWGTRTKQVGDEEIGLDRLAQVAAAVQIPVIAIGGVTPERARHLPATGVVGAAVVGALMSAGNPEEVARSLLAPWQHPLSAG